MQGVGLRLAYDGTDFSGWQAQKGQRTVQGVLAEAIEKMAGHSVTPRGASRTDAGVHALGQIAAFDAERTIDPEGWKLGINRTLPDDVAVQEAWVCEAGFNPRFHATKKVYRYLLYLGATTNPWWAKRSWNVARAYARKAKEDLTLDLDSMQRAMTLLQGKHPFSAFQAADDHRDNSWRTLFRVTIQESFYNERSLLAIEFEGDGFLKQMVRILVGTLVEIGLGRLSSDKLPSLLSEHAQRQDNPAKTAEAHGLTLVSVSLD